MERTTHTRCRAPQADAFMKEFVKENSNSFNLDRFQKAACIALAALSLTACGSSDSDFLATLSKPQETAIEAHAKSCLDSNLNKINSADCRTAESSLAKNGITPTYETGNSLTGQSTGTGAAAASHSGGGNFWTGYWIGSMMHGGSTDSRYVSGSSFKSAGHSAAYAPAFTGKSYPAHIHSAASSVSRGGFGGSASHAASSGG